MTIFNRILLLVLIIAIPCSSYSRYYHPRTATWLSADPPLMTGEYLPKPSDFDNEHDMYWYSLNDKTNKLPGMGGVFNPVNLNAYHYAGLNPVKYVDPDGNELYWYSAFNGDFGADYGNEAALNVENGKYGLAGLNITAGTCEVSYNMLLAYSFARYIPALANMGVATYTKLSIPTISYVGRVGKLNQHAKEWGVSLKGGPRAVAARMQNVVNSIVKGADTVKKGQWRGSSAYFYSRGKDVVVMDNNGLFRTILKNGTGNGHFRKAQTMWESLKK